MTRKEELRQRAMAMLSKEDLESKLSEYCSGSSSYMDRCWVRKVVCDHDQAQREEIEQQAKEITDLKTIIHALNKDGLTDAVMRSVIENRALREALRDLVHDCLASDFNEHWESYKQAQQALKEVS